MFSRLLASNDFRARGDRIKEVTWNADNDFLHFKQGSVSYIKVVRDWSTWIKRTNLQQAN